MHLLSTLLFALSSNMDNIAIGLSYGIKKIHLRMFHCLLIAGITALGTAAAMLAGTQIHGFISEKEGGILGGTLIIGIGLWGILRTLREQYGKAAGSKKKTQPTQISYKETAVLGAALAVNNIGLGIGASMTGLEPVFTSALSFLFSFLLLTAGNHIGRSKLSELIGKNAELTANILMIALGIYEMFI